MSGQQFQFALVFKADVASGKAGMTDLTGAFNATAAAGEKVSATAKKQEADLLSLAAATAKAITSQDQLVAAEQRAQAARARTLIAPLAIPAPAIAPMTAAYRATETAIGSLQPAVAGLTATIGNQAQETVEVAAANRAYQNSLDDIRASFNPLFAASLAYERQLERIAEAEKLGAVSAREAAAARIAAADGLMPMSSSPGNGVAGRASRYTANIGAQGFDVGVTAAMGMHPAMIGLQQGSQLAGIAQELGGGKEAAKGLAAGLMSIFNTTSLVTIGLTTMAAVGIQTFVKLVGGAKTVEDRMGDLKLATDRYKASADIAGGSMSDLLRDFGTGAGAAQSFYAVLVNIDRLSLDQKLKATSSAIRETLGTMSFDNRRGGNASRIADFFDLGGSGWGSQRPYAANLSALDQSVRDFEAADGIDAQTAAMQKLLAQVAGLAKGRQARPLAQRGRRQPSGQHPRTQRPDSARPGRAQDLPAARNRAADLFRGRRRSGRGGLCAGRPASALGHPHRCRRRHRHARRRDGGPRRLAR